MREQIVPYRLRAETPRHSAILLATSSLEETTELIQVAAICGFSADETTPRMLAHGVR